MSQAKIKETVERYLARARSRHKRHERSIRLGALLASCMVPLVVLASGSRLGSDVVAVWLIVGGGLCYLFRLLCRGNTDKHYQVLADDFAKLFPSESKAYRSALEHLVAAKPRKALLEELIQRIPEAAHVDLMTGSGAVTFAPAEESAASPKPKAAKKPKPSTANTGSVQGAAAGAPIKSFLELMNGKPFMSEAEMAAFLKDDPKAQAIMSKSWVGENGSVKTVKIFSSTTKTGFDSGASVVSKPTPPKPKAWKPEGALKSGSAPAPESAVAEERPDYIPLDPYER